MYFKYISKHITPFTIAIICVACEAFCDLLGPTLMARVINFGIEESDLNGVLYWGGFMLLSTACGACFAVTRNILASRVSQRVGEELRFDLFAKIMNLSERGADKIESGSLITRMTNDTAQVTQAVAGIMRIFLKAPITCIGSIVFATILNPLLSLIIYGVVIIVGIMIVISMKLSYPRFSRLQKATDRVNAVVQEYLIGIRLVKAFGTYDEEVERFGNVNTELYNRGISSQKVITLMSPIMSLVVGLGSVSALYFGSWLFEHELANPGDLSAFIMYMAQILTSLLMITNIFNVFVRTKASSARINEVFACEDDFAGSNSVPNKNNYFDTGSINRLEGSLCFENVTFTYPSQNENGAGSKPTPVIRNLSFFVGTGESLAVIGPTGSGKSTVCWLVLRFYDIDSGRILLGGKDIKTLDIDTIRKNIAIVPQKAMLFSGSVGENIHWGSKNASDEDMFRAAEQAQAGFINDMPDKYDSLLGSSGVNVSGGQKQRISIARGLIKDAPLLLLDDATSALDAVTEAKVRRTLMQLEQTVVLVTQRCTTAMSANKILVLDNGTAVGFGTHSELLKTCEMYKDIYRSQIGDMDD